ncbi:hypothetical protein F2Q70_00017049 [Brassica cretica]|uniref:Uncharacterized protein n=1 Tax=Brassica cretica TaxID=69181 RepID=A0A8S9HXW3_BRACR|nr:hypothetical protein F2Q70_00017049 [Brassica cretica]
MASILEYEEVGNGGGYSAHNLVKSEYRSDDARNFTQVSGPAGTVHQGTVHLDTIHPALIDTVHLTSIDTVHLLSIDTVHLTSIDTVQPNTVYCDTVHPGTVHPDTVHPVKTTPLAGRQRRSKFSYLKSTRMRC